MFQSLFTVLSAAVAISAGGPSILVDDGSDTGQHLVVTYLNSIGERQTGNQQQPQSIVAQDIFQIVAHNNTCVSLLLMNLPRSAHRSCNEALRLAKRKLQNPVAAMPPEDRSALLATVHSTLGIAQAIMGAEMNAWRSFQEACRLDPTYEAAHHNLETLGSGADAYAGLIIE